VAANRQFFGSLWAILLLALVVRLAALAEVGRSLPVAETVPIITEVGRVAASVAGGEGFSSPFAVPTGPTAIVPPVYVYLLAGAFKMFGTFSRAALLAILALNCLFGALTCAPIFFLARSVFGLRTAVWSAWFWALFPPFVLLPVQMVWETSASALLMALACWMTLRLVPGSTATRWTSYGAFWGLCGLTNPALLAAFPLLIAGVVIRWRPRWREAARHSVFALGALGLVLAPWLLRNYVVFGGPGFVRSNFGIELYLGNNLETADGWSPWLNPSNNREEAERLRTLGELRYAAEKREVALRLIAGNPTRFAALTAKRVVSFWLGTSDSLVDVWRAAAIGTALKLTAGGLLAILGLLGAGVAIHRRLWDSGPLVLTLLAYPLVYYVTHNVARYRHPVDPLLVPLAVWVVMQAGRRWSGRNEAGHPEG
jgi:hypothetical protein